MASPDPIRPEDLAKRYAGRWVIGQDINSDRTRGDWYAEPCSPEDEWFSARSLDLLAEQLERAAGRDRRG